MIKTHFIIKRETYGGRHYSVERDTKEEVKDYIKYMALTKDNYKVIAVYHEDVTEFFNEKV